MPDISLLEDQINDFEWILGAVNYDEDLHFSSYYIRASTPARSDPFYPGYGLIIGIYGDFTERYYLKRDECIHNAEVLTRRALRDTTWLSYILDEIVHRSNALECAFPNNASADVFAAMSKGELGAIYGNHHRLHTELYTYARVPEALDRGVYYFTNYLRSHLRGLGIGEDKLDETFNVLTQPVMPSILAQEVLDFERIVRVARHDPRARDQLLSFPRQARMLLTAGLMERVRQHAKRWRYLEYHGYGERRVADEASVIDRLVKALGPSVSGGTRRVLAGLADNRVRRDRILDELSIDLPHRELFDIYPEIGAVKLHRRYAQIRNFYYLDMLLSEIARQLQVEEWVVRCALPEEVLGALEGGVSGLDAVRDRRNGCMWVVRNEVEQFFTGDALRVIQAKLEDRAAPYRDRRVLKGLIASKGRVRGVCKIVIRASDAADKFPEGTILVSEATDPDLLNLLKVAGGVLTQQGGVTSHAAIICQEFGIPAIIGIEGLLETLKDGDVVELDAFSGTVRILDEIAEPPAGLVLETDAQDPTRVGGKAANLRRLEDWGFNVPPFVVLQADVIAAHLKDASEARQDTLRGWIQHRLSLTQGDTLAIRSSSLIEDASTGSLAGEFESILDVNVNEIADALIEFLNLNQVGKSGATYDGAIIIQQMIKADIGGVCLSYDPATDDNGTIVCEVAEGGSEGVTSGTSPTLRLRIRKGSADVIEAVGNTALEKIFGTQIVRKVCAAVVEIERHFEVAVDIEWGLREGKLYILQARSIVRSGLSA